MSTTVRTLRAVLTADTDGFTRGLTKAESALNKMSGAISALQGLAVLAVAKGAFDFMAGAVREFAEAELGVTKFQQAIKSLTPDVIGATQRATEFASALSRKSLFTDDSILGAQQLLASIGRLTGEGLERATKAAADLATGLGIDLEQAATMVAKAAQGQTTAFTRLGIEGKTLQDILSQIELRFGGVAEAATKTTAGAIQQLSKEFDELKEAIGGVAVGGGLLGMLQSVTDRLREIQDAANDKSILGFLLAINPVRATYKFASGAMATRGGAAAASGYSTDFTKQFPRSSEMSGGPAKIAADSGQASAAVQKLTSDVIALEEETFNFIARSPEFFGVFEGAEEIAVESFDKIQSKATETSSFLRQWAEGSASEYDRLFTSTVDSFSKLVGDSLLNLADFGEGFANIMRAAASDLIALFVRAGIQRLVLTSLNAQSAATEAAANLASGYAQTYVNSFASAAAIPVWGWAAAPGIAAANLAAAIAGSVSAMALGKGQGAAIAGFKEGGIIPGMDTGRDSVPIMARPGEAVLPKELTDVLLASGGGVEIHLHGDLPTLVTAINRETKRGNLRLVANEVRTTGLVR